MEIRQGQGAFIQLIIREKFVDQLLDQALDPGRRGVLQAPGGRFHYIGQHDQGCFPGLRLGTGIAEMVYIDAVVFFLFPGFFVEIADKRGTVMLFDGIGDFIAEFFLPGQFHPVFDV